MNAVFAALCVLGIVIAGALVGSELGKRLPREHLSESSKDIVKFGAGWIATLAALVLGLLVASAKSSYDAKAAEVEQSAAKVILLDQLLRQYGPEATQARDRLRALVVARHSMTWVTSESMATLKGAPPPRGEASFDGLRASVAALVPANDTQRSVQSRALAVLDDFVQLRWLFIAQSVAGISVPLLAVLVAWLGIIAFCTGLYAPRNTTVAGVALLCAVSMSAAIFLIVEMYQPFDGWLRISDAPLRAAISYLDD